MKKSKKVPSYVKETPEAHRERVASGVTFRPSVFPDKTKYTRKTKHKRKDDEHEH